MTPELTQQQQSSELRFRREVANRQVSISVIDSGIGMSPELLPRVFDSFTQGDTPDVQLDSALAWVCILFNLAVFTSCVRWRR